MPNTIPILFACSGCSNAGQLANSIAVELDRRGVAEMSCLAGVGAAKPLFLKKLSEREVWVIDGCPIHCSLGVFDQVREHVDVHIRLYDFGIKKKADAPTGEDFDALVEEVLQHVARQKVGSL
ncbi:DGC domain protein [Novipirellula aureliae]|uniref:DGC domain protein n=1 Tax=Novipirellula aureliae TaxID=2527966 RepID=A0A5C6EDN0_9BACT|nr:putative zinc-binding protein [Novipirellula aureliae]TWU45831.1 DGC domain protein [Novipirellula aureliae]